MKDLKQMAKSGQPYIDPEVHPFRISNGSEYAHFSNPAAAVESMDLRNWLATREAKPGEKPALWNKIEVYRRGKWISYDTDEPVGGALSGEPIRLETDN